MILSIVIACQHEEMIPESAASELQVRDGSGGGFDDRGHQKTCRELKRCGEEVDCELSFGMSPRDKNFKKSCLKTGGKILCYEACCGLLCSERISHIEK